MALPLHQGQQTLPRITQPHRLHGHTNKNFILTTSAFYRFHKSKKSKERVYFILPAPRSIMLFFSGPAFSFVFIMYHNHCSLKTVRVSLLGRVLSLFFSVLGFQGFVGPLKERTSILGCFFACEIRAVGIGLGSADS